MRLATVSVSTVAGLGLLRWYLDPAGSTRWMWLGLFLPMVWGYIELAQFRGADRAVAAKIMTFHRLSIPWAGLRLAVDVGVDLAVANGLLGPEWTQIARRLEGIILGSGLAIFGN